MKLEDAPQWVQEIVVETALNLLEYENTEITHLTKDEAVIRSDEFTYTASKYYGRVF